MIRLFVALAVPEEVARALTPLEAGLPGARWREAASLHLTLRFAGDLAEPVAADFAAELTRVRSAPFAVRLAGVGGFDNGGEGRALWAGAEVSEGPADSLAVLARRCEAAARRASLAPVRQRFRAHVTLAYLKGADPTKVAAWISAHNLFRAPSFVVSSFGLYSSRLGQAGSAYRLERLYSLT